MPTYYALYINDTIKTIFSSMYEFHKWVEVIYKPMHRNIKDLNICVKYLENMYEDDNYSLYLLVTESKDKIDHKFFSTTDDLKKEFTKLEKDKNIKKMTGIRIVINYTYEDCLKEGIIYKYPNSLNFINKL